MSRKDVSYIEDIIWDSKWEIAYIKNNISILCCLRNWFPISSTRFTSVSEVNLVEKEATEMLVIIQKWFSLFNQDGE